jgi:hypothetical protein
MSANTRKSLAVIILTALGVLPAIAADTRPERDDRFQYSRLNPIDLERATVVAALARVHDDIRAGRLGH